MTLPFGPYRGMPLRNVPDAHLYWVFETVSLRQPLLSAVEEEMERRAVRRAPVQPRRTLRPALARVTA